jgi:hypothetical protein
MDEMNQPLGGATTMDERDEILAGIWEIVKRQATEISQLAKDVDSLKKTTTVHSTGDIERRQSQIRKIDELISGIVQRKRDTLEWRNRMTRQ